MAAMEVHFKKQVLKTKGKKSSEEENVDEVLTLEEIINWFKKVKIIDQKVNEDVVKEAFRVRDETKIGYNDFVESLGRVSLLSKIPYDEFSKKLCPKKLFL